MRGGTSKVYKSAQERQGVKGVGGVRCSVNNCFEKLRPTMKSIQ